MKFRGVRRMKLENKNNGSEEIKNEDETQFCKGRTFSPTLSMQETCYLCQKILNSGAN